MIKLIVFDLDGTLINSLPSITYALDEALIAIDYPSAGIEKTRNWIGNGSDVLVARGMSDSADINPQLPADLLNKACQRFNQAYAEVGHEKDTIYAGVAETLALLEQANYQMAILTNKTECFIEPLLEHFAIDGFFSDLIAGNTLAERKPSPIGLNWLMKKYQLESNQLIMVGDSANDIKAGQAAGCISVGVTYGYNYGVPIDTLNPDYVLSEFADLLQLGCLDLPV